MLKTHFKEQIVDLRRSRDEKYASQIEDNKATVYRQASINLIGGTENNVFPGHTDVLLRVRCATEVTPKTRIEKLLASFEVEGCNVATSKDDAVRVNITATYPSDKTECEAIVPHLLTMGARILLGSALVHGGVNETAPGVLSDMLESYIDLSFDDVTSEP